MMVKVHTHNRMNSLGLKIIALIIGYSLWHIFSQQQMISVTFSAPLYFDTTNDSREISAPEAINITIAGTRQSIAATNVENCAIYVNADNLSSSTHAITLANKNLFLPAHVNLVNYEPAPLIITINDRSISNQESNSEHQGVHE